MKRFMHIFKRNFIKGELFFTFPDGKKLFRVKDSDLLKLPAKQFLNIQENSNYLGFLGVTKQNLQISVKNLDERFAKIEQSQNIEEINVIISECKKVTEFLKINTSEFDRASDAIALNLFDLFFYFQGENPIERSFESMELKKYYLDTYPYFKVFFFQEVQKYYKDFAPSLLNYIDFALFQMDIFTKINSLNHINMQQIQAQ